MTTAPIRLGLALHSPDTVYWALLAQSARRRAQQLGVELLVLIYPLGGPAVDTHILGDATVLITTARPVEDATTAALHTTGRPVIRAGGVGENVLCDVYSDERDSGEDLAALLVERLHGRGAIVEMRGVAWTIERSEGLHSVVSMYPEMQIVAQPVGDWDRTTAFEQMTRVLAAHECIDAVFCHNDDMALGVVDALRAARREGVLVTGFDGMPPGMVGVARGDMLATVYRSQEAVGARVVELAAAVARGEHIAPEVRTPSMVITQANVATSLAETVALMPELLRTAVESTAQQQRLQEEMIGAQQRLIQELSTPIIPITKDVLVVPLVGTIDTRRAVRITATVLAAVEQQHANTVLLDISGVPVVDTAVAASLLQMAQAARLLGTRVALVGITPEVAQTVVNLGIDLAGVRTYSDVQSALAVVLQNRVTA